MKHNGDRRPEEILAEIERTRSDMDSTLSAIEGRLTPGQLVDQGLDYLRNSGAKDFASNLGESVKSNPMPVALVGIGLAWLMAAGSNRSKTYSAGGTGVLSGVADSAKDKLAHTKDKLAQTKDKLSQTTQAARQQMDRVRSGYEHVLREQPLALGAVGLAIGALLAAAAPRTRKEDELMGAAAERFKEQAKEAGKEQLDKAKSVATAAKDRAKAL